MKQVVTAIRENSVYFLSALFLFIIGGLLLLKFGNEESFLALYRVHTYVLNIFFINYTFLGDGLFTLAICLILFYRKQKKLAFCILVAYLSSGLFTQVLKHVIYAPRPKLFFEATQFFYLLENISSGGFGTNSFPSGHTTSAFSLATVLAIYFKNNYISIFLLLAAILVGYARIYLAQHFPLDVLAGAFIGVLFATFSSGILNSNVAFLKTKSPL